MTESIGVRVRSGNSIRSRIQAYLATWQAGMTLEPMSRADSPAVLMIQAWQRKCYTAR